MEYLVEARIASGRIKRDDISTAITGLELVGAGLRNQSTEIANQRELAALVWEQFNQTIKAAQSVADFNGTILENKINQKELHHMQTWNMKMGTENPMLGTLKALYDEITSDEGEERRIKRKEARRERNAPAKDTRRQQTNVDQFLWLLDQVSKSKN